MCRRFFERANIVVFIEKPALNSSIKISNIENSTTFKKWPIFGKPRDPETELKNLF